jgi:hypothetical protein
MEWHDDLRRQSPYYRSPEEIRQLEACVTAARAHPRLSACLNYCMVEA